MEPYYYFDRIRIGSEILPETLMETLPVEELEKNCRRIEISEGYKPWLTGYKAKIDITAPTPDFLLLLKKCQILKNAKISYIEIAKDTPTPTEEEASKTVMDFHFTKKWGNFHKTFFNPPYTSKSQYCGIVGKTTGSKYFKCCIYARFSKVTGEPASHREWRISGKRLIQEKTGIASIADLPSFDFSKFFEITDQKYLVPDYRTDRDKLIQYLTGFTNRTLTRRENIHAGCVAAGYDKKSYAATIAKLRQVKKYSAKKVNETETRIKYLKNYTQFKGQPY